MVEKDHVIADVGVRQPSPQGRGASLRLPESDEESGVGATAGTEVVMESETRQTPPRGGISPIQDHSYHVPHEADNIAKQVREDNSTFQEPRGRVVSPVETAALHREVRAVVGEAVRDMAHSLGEVVSDTLKTCMGEVVQSLQAQMDRQRVERRLGSPPRKVIISGEEAQGCLPVQTPPPHQVLTPDIDVHGPQPRPRSPPRRVIMASDETWGHQQRSRTPPRGVMMSDTDDQAQQRLSSTPRRGLLSGNVHGFQSSPVTPQHRVVLPHEERHRDQGRVSSLANRGFMPNYNRRRGPPDSAAMSSEDDECGSRASRRSNYNLSNSVKLPPFNGKEKWEVWYARFSEVAKLHSWSNRRCLQELLPRLQGPAGEFVYAQLPEHVRGSYERLVSELNARFKTVETRKTFAAQFSARNQKPGEVTEEYAAELKRLYNKAYPHRGTETRNEDLLRRFLDGLYDERTRFHIEFVKEPRDIDQAVFEVVNFAETRRRPRDREGSSKHRPTRAVKSHYSSESEEEPRMVQPSDSDSEEDDHRVARVPPKHHKSKKIKRPSESTKPTESVKVTTPGKTSDYTEEKLDNFINKIKEASDAVIAQMSREGTFNPQSQRKRRSTNDFQCFRCGEPGHFARNCPQPKWGKPGDKTSGEQAGAAKNTEGKVASATPVTSGETSN